MTKVGGVPQVNDFKTLQALQAENTDAWIYLGDTIYSDSSFRPGGPATTLADYRATYHEGRTYPNLTNLLASTSTYPTWDDHEVVNDYAAATVDPARYAAGRKAFFENMPIRETGLLHDASCAGDPIYRKYSWGSDVDIFMLDERSCRSAESVTACFGDLAPTLPTAARTTFPFSLFLSPTPPAGCLASLNNPSRTMLGPVQKAAVQERPGEFDSAIQVRSQPGPDPAVLRTSVRPLGGLRRRAFRDPELHPEQRHRQHAVPDHGHARDAPEPGGHRPVHGPGHRSRTRW